MLTTLSNGLKLEEHFLPEGSYNKQCTLNSVWSDKEVMVPDLSELSESVLRLMLQNIALQIEEECKDA